MSPADAPAVALPETGDHLDEMDREVDDGDPELGAWRKRLRGVCAACGCRSVDAVTGVCSCGAVKAPIARALAS